MRAPRPRRPHSSRASPSSSGTASATSTSVAEQQSRRVRATTPSSSTRCSRGESACTARISATVPTEWSSAGEASWSRRASASSRSPVRAASWTAVTLAGRSSTSVSEAPGQKAHLVERKDRQQERADLGVGRRHGCIRAAVILPPRGVRSDGSTCGAGPRRGSPVPRPAAARRSPRRAGRSRAGRRRPRDRHAVHLAAERRLVAGLGRERARCGACGVPGIAEVDDRAPGALLDRAARVDELAPDGLRLRSAAVSSAPGDARARRTSRRRRAASRPAGRSPRRLRPRRAPRRRRAPPRPRRSAAPPTCAAPSGRAVCRAGPPRRGDRGSPSRTSGWSKAS